jgi:hypothetical protein
MVCAKHLMESCTYFVVLFVLYLEMMSVVTITEESSWSAVLGTKATLDVRVHSHSAQI